MRRKQQESELIPHAWLNKRTAKKKRKSPTFGQVMFQLIGVFFLAIFICIVVYLSFTTVYERIANHQTKSTEVFDCDCGCEDCNATNKDANSKPDFSSNNKAPNEPVTSPKQKTSSKPDSIPLLMSNSFETRQKLADALIELYYRNEWDGYPTKINGHTVSLSSVSGCLTIDGSISSPSKILPSHCLDLPPEMVVTRFDEVCFIIGDGSYLIRDNQLVKYSHGEQIPLSGGELDWEGMNTGFYRPLDTFFFYDEPHDALFIAVSSVPYDLSNKALKYNVGIFLYVVPDRTKSEIEFVSEVTNVAFDNNGVFYYYDTSGNLWRYTIMNDELRFLQAFDCVEPINGGIGSGIIQFNWWLTFADGNIKDSLAFPAGTFSKPVITVPSVNMAEYEFTCKYLDKYNTKETD